MNRHHTVRYGVPELFEAVRNGFLRMEILRDSACYQSGETITLECDGHDPIDFRIGFVLRNVQGIEPGYAAFQLEPLTDD